MNEFERFIHSATWPVTMFTKGKKGRSNKDGKIINAKGR